MVTEAHRRMMHDGFTRLLGPELGEIVMEHMPPVPWYDVARQDAVDALGVSLRGEIAQVRGEIAELRGEVRAQLPRLIAANIASMIGVAGLVLGAAKIA